jgi:Uncharacterised nucleotidyltransferase
MSRNRLPPELRLATLCAGTAETRAASRDAARELTETVDWGALAGALRERRLLALLGERILELAADRAPDRFADATQRAISEGQRQDAFLQLVSIQLMAALDTAGIPSLALKGALLGEAIYGSSGRRPSGDIDLLLASEHLRRAIEVAARHGYHDTHDCRSREGLPMLHFRLQHERFGVPPLELHWRVHWYDREFSRDLLMRSGYNGQRWRRATPTDELTSLLLFYARDGFVDLRLACDLAAWWDALGDQVPAGALQEIASSYPGLERVLLAATTVADQVVGVPSNRLLGGHRALEPRVRLATRLANPDARGARQQQIADAWLVDWLLTPPGGRRECIRRQLQTPGNLGHGETPPQDTRVACVTRGVRLLRHYALALLRIAFSARRTGLHQIRSRVTNPTRVAGRPTA